MKKINLTENEIKVLIAFINDDFVNDDGWENEIAQTWAEDFHKDAKITAKSFSGVMSSLNKKGIIKSDIEAIRLTEEGRNQIRIHKLYEHLIIYDY